MTTPNQALPEHFKPIQSHENDIAKVVLVHTPGIEALLGSLNACGSLFEKPVNLHKARENHAKFKQAMRDRGVHVLNVRTVLTMDCDKDLKQRMKLEDLAARVLQYSLEEHDDESPVEAKQEPEIQINHITKQQEYFLSDEYKRKCLSALGVEDLVDIILMGPTVSLAPSTLNTPLRLDNLSMKPCLNLTFTRDQQLVTRKGLIINNMGSKQRKREIEIMKFCFEKLGIAILGEILPPGTSEGGDFISAGADLCFIGVGLRTNQEAVDCMLQNDWFGTRRVAVVRDVFDWSQQRMHLDTVFNICSDDCCVMLDTIIGKDSPIRRLVTEYTKGKDNQYYITKRDVEFSEYVKQEGYHIIPITDEQQHAYGINFLNLGDGYIISVDESTSRSILSDKNFKGSIQVIDYSGMTTMYGSVHCCSQVLYREPRDEIQVPLKMEDLPSKNFIPYTNLEKLDKPSKNVLMVVPSFNLHSINRLIAKQCRKEMSLLHQQLTKNGINTLLVPYYQGKESIWTPFPAHLISTHSKFETESQTPKIILYPIKQMGRRKERDILVQNHLKDLYEVEDLSKLEEEEVYFEGSEIVLDRIHKILFVKEGANEQVLKRLSKILNYKIVTLKMKPTNERAEFFNSVSSVLFIGTALAIICPEMIENAEEVLKVVEETGREIIKITNDQRLAFCTSVVQLQNAEGISTFFISKTAYSSFTKEHIEILQKHGSIEQVLLTTIEKIGKMSIASMLAVLQ